MWWRPKEMDWLSKGEVARVELFVLLHRQSDRGCKTQACAACSKSNQGQAWLGNCVISRCNSPAGTGLNCQNTPKATEARGGQATRGVRVRTGFGRQKRAESRNTMSERQILEYYTERASRRFIEMQERWEWPIVYICGYLSSLSSSPI